MFLALRDDPDGLLNVAEMNNVLSAWINSGLYRKNHADRKYRGMLGRFEKLVAGCIFRGTSIGVQYDRKISIKDLSKYT